MSLELQSAPIRNGAALHSGLAVIPSGDSDAVADTPSGGRESAAEVRMGRRHGHHRPHRHRRMRRHEERRARVCRETAVVAHTIEIRERVHACTRPPLCNRTRRSRYRKGAASAGGPGGTLSTARSNTVRERQRCDGPCDRCCRSLSDEFSGVWEAEFGVAGCALA